MSKQIPLTKGYFAIVDDADFDWLNQWSWRVLICQRRPGLEYALRTDRTSQVYRVKLMHREILGILDSGFSVKGEHRDGNGLNNQRENLRIATNSQNLLGFQRLRTTKTSKFRGVRWNQTRNHWTAQYNHLGKQTYLGRFDTELEAAKAYDSAVIETFGEFASPNFTHEPHKH